MAAPHRCQELRASEGRGLLSGFRREGEIEGEEEGEGRGRGRGKGRVREGGEEEGEGAGCPWPGVAPLTVLVSLDRKRLAVLPLSMISRRAVVRSICVFASVFLGGDLGDEGRLQPLRSLHRFAQALQSEHDSLHHCLRCWASSVIVDMVALVMVMLVVVMLMITPTMMTIIMMMIADEADAGADADDDADDGDDGDDDDDDDDDEDEEEEEEEEDARLNDHWSDYRLHILVIGHGSVTACRSVFDTCRSCSDQCRGACSVPCAIEDFAQGVGCFRIALPHMVCAQPVLPES